MSLVTVDISSYDAFRTATLGNGYDVDGVYGYQCVDMAKLLAGNAGRPSPYWKSDPDGYAYEGWSVLTNREYNAADYFTLVYNKADVRRGDLVVLENTSSNPYVHIAFADEDWDANTNYAMLLGQNQVNPSATVGHVVTLTGVNVSTFLGAFRFNAWQPSAVKKNRFNAWQPSAVKKNRFKWVLYANKLRKKY